jgi:uncharacterized protein
LKKKVTLRFYEELNDFLPEKKKKKRFEHNFIDRTSVKDLIESLGVPHTEIDLILVNSKSVNFKYIINDSDDISVYPVFESLDISDVQHLRPKPLRNPKFIADVHLGRLARYLRMMGFDVYYKNNLSDDEIVKISSIERRAILTRDIGILKRTEVTHGYFIRGDSVEKQTEEVVNRFDLQKSIKEFTRCLECNTKLTKIKKEKIIRQLPPMVAASQNEFFICPKCQKLFWAGTHHQKMLSLVPKIKTMNFS